MRKQWLIILILGALSTISPFSIDMYLPGFPAIATDLATSIAQVQLSLTAYLVGIAAGQLLYGPLLDRFGRRTPLYAGLVVYLLASIGCTFTTSIEGLIAMRFLQALGGCAGMVASQALVRDLFPVNKIAQAFSSITLVIAVSPMIAPTVGGYVSAAYGWQSVFVVLTILTALILISVYFFLPEGKRADDTLSLSPQAVLNNFFTVLSQRQFLIYALAGGIATAAPFAYIAGSSNVFINIHHFTERQYGWIFAFIAIAIIGSTQFNYTLLQRFTSQQLTRFALIYQTTVGLTLVLGTQYGWFGKYALIGMLFLFLLGQGLTGPNSTALSLAPFSRLAGSAAALLGSFRMAIGGIVTASVSFFHNNTAVPMVGVMVSCSVIGLTILTIGNRAVRVHPAADEAKKEQALI